MYTESKKMAALLKTDTATESNPKDTAEPSKWQTVLRGLTVGSLNRFEAERYANDHCLNSTIPVIEARGVRVSREWETVPCRGGKGTVRVLRYWVESEGENLKRAQALVGRPSSGR